MHSIEFLGLEGNFDVGTSQIFSPSVSANCGTNCHEVAVHADLSAAVGTGHSRITLTSLSCASRTSGVDTTVGSLTGSIWEPKKTCGVGKCDLAVIRSMHPSGLFGGAEAVRLLRRRGSFVFFRAGSCTGAPPVLAELAAQFRSPHNFPTFAFCPQGCASEPTLISKGVLVLACQGEGKCGLSDKRRSIGVAEDR